MVRKTTLVHELEGEKHSPSAIISGVSQVGEQLIVIPRKSLKR